MKRITLILITTLTLALTACGGDGDDSTATGITPAVRSTIATGVRG